MFRGTPLFLDFDGYGKRFSRFGGVSGWLMIGPGLSLLLVGLAILVWPELLAYMVAGLFMVIGGSLSLFGWRLLRLARRRPNVPPTVQYDVQYRDIDPGHL